ncbi:hypothetical protein DSO57_1006894 [Entomophthora muscae]|uniref:Uncharacterized protein n=1 Tax=Entomophthora muscae TaxID=34485 RepID=A0ACC2U665_9FUNG|nr:hypothetical protein DSO57_1006894 [Entomophthora muscae]
MVAVHSESPVLSKLIAEKGGYIPISKVVEAVSTLIEDAKMSGDSISVTPKGNQVLPRLKASVL